MDKKFLCNSQLGWLWRTTKNEEILVRVIMEDHQKQVLSKTLNFISKLIYNKILGW